MVGLKLLGVFSVFSVVIPMCIFTTGSGLVRPQAMAAAIVPYPEKAGLASALMGFVPMSSAGLFVTGFAYFYSASSTPMAVAIACAGIVALLVRFILLPSSKANT